MLFSTANLFSELIAADEAADVTAQISNSNIDGSQESEVSNAVKQEEQKRDIRIQFEGVPYTDALQRFSQMANKPLIVESSLEGTLTFFDPEPYSYREALDVLNVILSLLIVICFPPFFGWSSSC